MTGIDDCVETALRDVAPSTLTLSPRDVQILAAALVIAGTVLRDDDDIIEHNCDMLARVYHEAYSAPEFNALSHAVRALLPADTPLHFVQGFRVASLNTQVH